MEENSTQASFFTKNKRALVAVLVVVVIAVAVYFVIDRRSRMDSNVLTEEMLQDLLRQAAGDGTNEPPTEKELQGYLKTVAGDKDTEPVTEEEVQAMLKSASGQQ